MKRKYAGSGLLVAMLLCGAPVLAQDEPAEEPAATDAPAVEETQPADSGETETDKKLPFALYVEAATGTVDSDSIDPSLKTLSTHVTSTSLDFDEFKYGRAAIGWKLPHGKGDFRLAFNGYSEDGYTLTSTGSSSRLANATGQQFSAPVVWWELGIENGTLQSSRTPAEWTAAARLPDNSPDPNNPNDDANLDDIVDPGEVRYDQGIDIAVTRPVAANLENRAQTIDFLYGRDWGPRNFRGRWWGGLRYFNYDGTIPVTGWLNTAVPGEGFTDGSFLRIITLRQETTGLGPTGALEGEFNFFNQRLGLFLGGQFTFIILDQEMDSGRFFTLAQDPGEGDPSNVPAAAQLTQSQNKSTWQTGAEAGVRVKLKNGLRLELAYFVSGFLDIAIVPTELRIPENPQESAQGSSALYNTQDFVFDGFRGGISFQF